jgi:protein-disulfide isomerase
VTIVEFSDYQCPYCRIVADTLRVLRERYPNDVRLVYRHYPLQSIHPRALELAVAAECARIQGGFERFHYVLFSLQDSLGSVGLTRLARHAEIQSPERLSECVRSGQGLPIVLEDIAAGDRLGVVGTPTILLNQDRYPGYMNLSLLDSLVQKALATSN